MLAKHLSRRVPENMNHIYVLFLLGNTLVKAFSSENTKKKKKAIWSPPGFHESAGPGSGGRCGRKLVAGRRAGCIPWSQAAGSVHRSVLPCHRGASARREVSFFSQHDTVHALKVTGIFGLHTSTGPADYMQTHPRCLFWERRRSACQPSLGRGPFAKSDGWWEFRLSLWSPYLNLNACEMFSDYGEVMLMSRPYPVILLFHFLVEKLKTWSRKINTSKTSKCGV